MVGAVLPVDWVKMTPPAPIVEEYLTESAKYASSAVTRLRRSDFIEAMYAFSFVFANFGIAMAAKMPMITTTISSSIRVKPLRFIQLPPVESTQTLKQHCSNLRYRDDTRCYRGRQGPCLTGELCFKCLKGMTLNTTSWWEAPRLALRKSRFLQGRHAARNDETVPQRNEVEAAKAKSGGENPAALVLLQAKRLTGKPARLPDRSPRRVPSA